MPNGLFSFGRRRKEPVFRRIRVTKKTTQKDIDRFLGKKTIMINRFKKSKIFKEANPKLKQQLLELEQIKTRPELRKFIQKHFPADIPERLINKPMLTKDDVKDLSFFERQELGFLRARKFKPVQSRLTLIAVGSTPILPLPIALALAR